MFSSDRCGGVLIAVTGPRPVVPPAAVGWRFRDEQTPPEHNCPRHNCPHSYIRLKNPSDIGSSAWVVKRRESKAKGKMSPNHYDAQCTMWNAPIVCTLILLRNRPLSVLCLSCVFHTPLSQSSVLAMSSSFLCLSSSVPCMSIVPPLASVRVRPPSLCGQPARARPTAAAPEHRGR